LLSGISVSLSPGITRRQHQFRYAANAAAVRPVPELQPFKPRNPG
jgi:hypothetical protein